MSLPDGLLMEKEVKATVNRSMVPVAALGYMAMLARLPVNLAVSMPPKRSEPDRASDVVSR